MVTEISKEVAIEGHSFLCMDVRQEENLDTLKLNLCWLRAFQEGFVAWPEPEVHRTINKQVISAPSSRIMQRREP